MDSADFKLAGGMGRPSRTMESADVWFDLSGSSVVRFGPSLRSARAQRKSTVGSSSSTLAPAGKGRYLLAAMVELDPTASRPDSQAVSRRVLVLRHVASYGALVPPRAQLQQTIASWSEEERARELARADQERDAFWATLGKLAAELSPWERKLAETNRITMSAAQQVAATWRAEAIRTLLWALGLLPELMPYDVAAGPESVQVFPAEKLRVLLGSAALREFGELERARATAELWLWRAKTWQLVQRGQPFPRTDHTQKAGIHSFDDVVRMTAKLALKRGTIPESIDEDFAFHDKAYRSLSSKEHAVAQSIAFERLFSLNWLCGRAPAGLWDKTPVST